MRKVPMALLLVALFSVFADAAVPFDSLALENNKGKIFVIHKVDKQETLYRLLKRYQCTPAEVLAANPTLDASSTIYENQVLRIPYKTLSGTTVELPAAVDKVTVIDPAAQQANRDLKNAAASDKKLYHIVADGETLYSISKFYDVPVEKLRAANDLPDNSLTIGQKLIIAKNYTPKGPAGDDDKTKKTAQKSSKAPTYVPNAPRGEVVEETGIAAPIELRNGSAKYLALHRFAPVGTQIKVKNDATNDFVYVKVIGKLPETGNNQNVLIRLSPVAYNKLNPRDSRIRAVISYEMPKN